MLIRLPKKDTLWFLFDSILVIFLIGQIVSTGFAKLAANTIDPVARISSDGRQIVVTGPIRCTESQQTFVRVTVTQRTTGAVAEGHAILDCTTETQHWEVRLSAEGKESFQEGPATATALAKTRTARGDVDDAHQWLVNISLTTN